MEALAEQIRMKLTSRQPVSDEQFDALLPVRPRIRSASYWSSVEVAQTASQWLTEAGAQRVLDVGSGVGKFCSVASLSSSRRVWGVELRPDLALASRELAQRLGAEVVIIDSPLASIDPSQFDGFYFFNPFAEHLAEAHERYDDRFPASVDGFINDVRLVERWLRAAPIGTAMVSYNGLGGRIPLSWVVEKSELVNGDHLRLWIKRGLDDSSDAIIEVNEYLLPASRLASLIQGGDPRVKGNSLVARLVSPGST